MLCELLHPGVTDEDRLLLGILLIDLEAPTLSLSNDVKHELSLEGAEHSEEEVSLWKLVRELLLGWEVLIEDWILHRILVQVLH